MEWHPDVDNIICVGVMSLCVTLALHYVQSLQVWVELLQQALPWAKEQIFPYLEKTSGTVPSYMAALMRKGQDRIGLLVNKSQSESVHNRDQSAVWKLKLLLFFFYACDRGIKNSRLVHHGLASTETEYIWSWTTHSCNLLQTCGMWQFPEAMVTCHLRNVFPIQKYLWWM